jgi:hypothetical protein
MDLDRALSDDLERWRPTAVLPGRWTFWADTMVGARPLGVVDVSAFSCTSRLSDFGYGQVTLVHPSGLEAERLLALWSWRLWVFYEGEPFWCGVPTGLTDENGATWTNFTLTELPGYLRKRQWDVPPPPRVYTQIEQTAIANDIALPVQDVGVRIVLAQGPGVRRDRTYEYLESQSRAQLLTNLAGVEQGPEFRTEYRMLASGLPECILRIAYPRVGADAGGLSLTVPGGAIHYRATWDSDQLRTRTFAVGDIPSTGNVEQPRPVIVVERTQAELPRLDAVDDWPGTIMESTLRERANTAALIQAAPSLVLTGSPPESFPPVTSYGVGDDVLIRAATPLIPGGIAVPGRLTEVSVNAQQGTATWTVTVAAPPPRPRETLAGQLGRMDTALNAVFHRGPLTPR